MPKFDRDTARLIYNETGEEIKPGSMVFRGPNPDDEMLFRFISKLPGGGSTGKVIVSYPCGHHEDDEPFYCNGTTEREFYPSVVGARIEIVET